MPTSVSTLIARQLRALGHPKRLEIMQVLGHRTLHAADIQRMTDIPQAALSQHLRALKVARIIVAERQGRWILFRVSHTHFEQAITLLRTAAIVRPPRSREQHRRQVQDPVCQMWIEPAAANWQAIYKGATYFFCASGCHRRFTTAPETYA